jgi:hypothetical protein
VKRGVNQTTLPITACKTRRRPIEIGHQERTKPGITARRSSKLAKTPILRISDTRPAHRPNRLQSPPRVLSYRLGQTTFNPTAATLRKASWD